jgi:release factor glutamine methyltransferase
MKATELERIAAVLAAAGCIAPDEEAAELIDAAGGDRDLLERLLARRRNGEPLEWIIGSMSFCGTTIRLAPGVYVPRWQTELLVRRAVELVPGNGVALDFCTGSGAVAAALAALRPDVRIVATDNDETAAACARSNRVDVRLGDLDEPLPDQLRGGVDLITAVVPYVPSDAIRLLPRDVQRYEPLGALDGGDGGLVVLERVVTCSRRWLRPGGWLLLELGGDQAQPMTAQMREAGFTRVRVLRDEEGDDRAIEGCSA